MQLAITSGSSHAETACSKVSIEILQELTIERVAFDAKLVLTNNMPDKDLTAMRVDVTIRDKDGNIKNDIFFTKVSSLQNLTGVDGTGVVRAGTSAEAHWLIIPSPGAGGETTTGIDYWIGATITYIVAEKQESVSVNPDKITVKPMPQLILDYFMPFNVLGDNPFTSKVEPPIPYPLSVRVLNDGFGTAAKLKIDSAQPKIVSNDQGLLIDFKLLGASVNDSVVNPSLTVNMGDLASKKISTAYWEMISTLSGRFIEFGVSFTHASELGGELTSLLKETNAHYLVHRVKANLPGRDTRLDFLADTDRDAEHLPDALFESEIPAGSTKREDARSPVSVVAVVSQPPRPTAQSPDVPLQVASGQTGWLYARLSDPSQGLLKLLDVVRGDGVRLDPNNFWVEQGLDSNYQKIFTLHVLDFRSDAGITGAYTLKFTQPDTDTTSPTTSLIFDGPSVGTNPVYIAPDTRIILSARDNDGGSGIDQMLKKVLPQDTDFVPAFPFTITTSGAYTLEYYSIDLTGNQETPKSAAIIVDTSAPSIASFHAIPSIFVPQAPKGVSAPRKIDFVVKASDTSSNLPLTIEIAKGNEFSSSNVVRTLVGTASPGADFTITWDGKDDKGGLIATGIYTALLKISDGLNNTVNLDASHTATASTTVTAAEWFVGEPIDPNLSGDQMYPEVSGTKVVWQDKRNGNWDIYMKDMIGGPSRWITTNSADQTHPSIDGDIIVWQDYRNGNWDIYGYDLSKGQEFIIATDAGNQEMPVISNGWAAWQDNRNGNWDIYAYNIATQEKIRITSHERDQINPAVSGNTIVWEDYRHGLGEIYKYDLSSRIEARITVNINNQTQPKISGATMVWTDQRNSVLSEQRDIYAYISSAGEKRATYGTWDEVQAAILNNTIVYVDYESGLQNPDISFYDINTGLGGKLTANPAKQEEPVLTNDAVFWQDDRDGVYQIYRADFKLEAIPIQVELKTGFNLTAVGDKLVNAYPKASALIQAYPDMEKVMAFDNLHGFYTEASPLEGDFDLGQGMGIIVYAVNNFTLELAESGETVSYTLLQGENHIGILTIPAGYRAYDLINSIGIENIQSVRRFDTHTGAWNTVAVRDTSAGKEIVGVNFAISPGDGLIVTAKKRIDGWKP